MRNVLFKICKRLRRKWYTRLSTLIPEGQANIQHPVLFEGKGRVILGSNVTFGYFPSEGFISSYTHIEARNSDAIIRIGNNNHFNNNLTIIAEHGEINIGNNCLVGTNVSIINSDFHSISISKRHNGSPKSKDVVIGNNVFIGSNVSICKGVHVGDNAVIANGAVVFDDVKANTIVRGNPATFYKEIYE